MSKGWGEEDYDDDLPDWMRAETYRNGGLPKIKRKSVEELAAEILKKPPIPVILKDPTKGFDNE
jgi:hypothetical protein